MHSLATLFGTVVKKVRFNPCILPSVSPQEVALKSRCFWCFRHSWQAGFYEPDAECALIQLGTRGLFLIYAIKNKAYHIFYVNHISCRPISIYFILTNIPL